MDIVMNESETQRTSSNTIGPSFGMNPGVLNIYLSFFLAR